MPSTRLTAAVAMTVAYMAGSTVLGNPLIADQQPSADQEETFVFFIPDPPIDEQLAYIFDTERNHLLISSNRVGELPRGLPRNRDADEWIVLPGNIRAYRTPSFNSSPSDIELSFPQAVQSVGTGPVTAEGSDWVAFEYNDTIFYLPVPLLARRAVDKISGNYPIGKEPVSRDHPIPEDYRPSDLLKLDQTWNFHGPDYPKLLRAEAARVIEEMLTFARRQGVNIRVFSAYRSYARQRYLYLKKIRQEGLTQLLVAKPGHSEHQLGTAVDLCSPDPASVASADFGSSREGAWLREHSTKFGFIQSYREDNRRESGYLPEPWHYRYTGKRPPP